MYCKADFSAKSIRISDLKNWRKVCLFDPEKFLPQVLKRVFLHYVRLEMDRKDLDKSKGQNKSGGFG